MSDTIQVCLRVRPPLQREKLERLQIHWRHDDQHISQIESKNSSGSTYAFDKIFGMETNNMTVFEHIKPIIESTVKGYHGTIFAYGQTSSGKTFTMMGNKGESGIIPQALDYIFQCIENTTDRTYLLRASYMEIYNEIITDLLSEKQQNTKETSLKIYEDASGLPCVSELKEEFIKNKKEAIALMKKGETNRHIGNTLMNEKSSRSHTIFRMIIESRSKVEDGEFDPNCAFMVSHLNLVDLAGSEKTASVATSATRFKEGCAINLSLLQLSQVISKLSEGDGSFVNYRNSNLTRILKPSLGGNAKTAVICTVSPVTIDETLSTLKFADRAKKVKNKPIVNSTVAEGPLLKQYESEIQALKVQIEKEKHQSQQMLALEEQLEKKDDKILELEKKIKTMQAKMVVSSQCTPKNSDLIKRNNRRETWCAPLAMRNAAKGTSLLSSLIDLPDDMYCPSSKEAKHKQGFQRNSFPEVLSESKNSQVKVNQEEDDVIEGEDIPVFMDTAEDFQNELLHSKEELNELRFRLLNAEKENSNFQSSLNLLRSELAKEKTEKQEMENNLMEAKKQNLSAETLIKESKEKEKEVSFLKKRLEDAKQELADFIREASVREELDAEEIRKLKTSVPETKQTPESAVIREALENEIQNLKTELESSKLSSLKSHQHKISLQTEYETKIKESELIIEGLQKEIHDLKTELESGKLSFLKYQENEVALCKEFQERELKVKEREEKLECIMNENSALNLYVEDLRNQLSKEENKSQALSEELSKQKTKEVAEIIPLKEVRELEEKIKELERTLSNKEKHNQNLEEKVLKAVKEAQVNDLNAKQFRNKLNFAIEKEAKLQAEIKSIKKQLHLEQFENTTLKQSLKEVNDYQNQEQNKYSELTRKYMAIERELVSWQKRAELYSEKEGALVDSYNKYQRIMKEQNNELIKLNKENLMYKTDIKSTNEFMERVKGDNSKKYVTIGELHTSYLKKIDELHDEIDKIKNSLSEAKQMLITTKYKEEELVQQLADEQRAHSATQDKLKAVEQASIDKQEEMQATIEELKVSAISNSSRASQSSKNNSDLCSSKDCKAIAELDEAELKICELYDLMDQEKRKLNRKIRDIECEGYVKDDRIAELEACVSSDVQTLTDEIRSLKAQIAELKDEIFQKRVELNDAKMKLKLGEVPYKEKIESLQKDVETYLEKISHLKNENRRLMQQTLDSTVRNAPRH